MKTYVLRVDFCVKARTMAIAQKKLNSRLRDTKDIRTSETRYIGSYNGNIAPRQKKKERT